METVVSIVAIVMGTVTVSHPDPRLVRNILLPKETRIPSQPSRGEIQSVTIGSAKTFRRFRGDS